MLITDIIVNFAAYQGPCRCSGNTLTPYLGDQSSNPGQWITVQNVNQLYVLVSSILLITYHNYNQYKGTRQGVNYK